MNTLLLLFRKINRKRSSKWYWNKQHDLFTSTTN